MTNSKTFILAAAAALSLGVGTAMAQESADGAFLLQLPWPGSTPVRHHVAPAVSQPQAGSSDFERIRAPIHLQQTLEGGDGPG
jgi:hypothetical protein